MESVGHSPAAAPEGASRGVLVRPMVGTVVLIIGMAPAWSFVSLLGFAFAEQLAISTLGIGMLAACVSIGYVATALPLGYRIDRSGGNWPLTRAPFVLALGFLLATMRGHLVTLALLALLAGGLWAGSVAAMNRYVLVIAPPGRQGLLMGISQTAIMATNGVGALVFPLIAIQWSWRAALLGLAALALVGGLGSSTAFRGEFAVPRPDQAPQTRGWPRFGPRFWALLGYGLLMGIAMHCTWTFLLLYLTEDRALPTGIGALGLALLFTSAAVGRLVWGLVLDREVSMWALLALCAAGGAVSVLALLAVASSTVATLAAVFALGLFLLGHNTVFIVTGLRMSDASQWALAGASLTVSHVVGGIVGPPLFALIVDGTGTYMWAWLFVMVMLAASLAALRLARP